jgi:DNA-binding LytR/AlgR family response regulator
MNCIIVDDEPLARKGIENFVKEIPFLHHVASCSNALQAATELDAQQVDLMFLDIQMPRITGIDFLKSLHKGQPITIITSAFPDYAVISYELDVMDYLVKPIPFERFLKAVNKAKDFFELKHTNQQDTRNDFFFIKCDNRFEKIFFDEVLFVQALQNYVVIHTENKRMISYLTIKMVEEYLPKSMFLKISKSYIVSLPKIESISGNEIKIGTHAFSIGRTNKEQVLEHILGNKLLKRNKH